jgi:predicted peptidase
MQLFAKEQIVEGTIKDKSFKYPIPYIYFKPLKCDKKNIPIIVFVQGINGSTSAGKVMKCEFYNDKILFTYEKMSEGDNKNRASIQARKYISELKLIIEKIKTIYKNNPIYLLGQSFGSAICMQYIRKYPQDINGIAC